MSYPLDLHGASFSQVLCRVIDAPACEQRLHLDLESSMRALAIAPALGPPRPRTPAEGRRPFRRGR